MCVQTYAVLYRTLSLCSLHRGSVRDAFTPLNDEVKESIRTLESCQMMRILGMLQDFVIVAVGIDPIMTSETFEPKNDTKYK